MQIHLRECSRTFTVGKNHNIEIRDLGDIHLEPNEQISFVTESGCRYDFVAKDWGFYATPSINGRLKNEGFKTALVQNSQGKVYIMVVEEIQLQLFQEYCSNENQKLLAWLDE
ncbi:MAG: hypothetical protein MH825_05040 [Cyanobacteria bacterium]|nr:hypothetical protein [Cyanobacteriota bacterium]